MHQEELKDWEDQKTMNADEIPEELSQMLKDLIDKVIRDFGDELSKLPEEQYWSTCRSIVIDYLHIYMYRGLESKKKKLLKEIEDLQDFYFPHHWVDKMENIYGKNTTNVNASSKK